MKKKFNSYRNFIHMAILVCIIISGTSASLFAQGRGAGVVNCHGRLQVMDAHVCAENGEQISLAGMSFFWSNWAGAYYEASTVDYLVDEFQVSLVRAAYGVPHDGSPDGDYSKIERVVEAAIARDIYVLIDWHTEGDAWNHYNEAVDFFNHFASKYGSYPHVIFELWNEPISSGTTSLRDWCQQMANIIRSHGSNNLVICGSDTWSQYPNSYTINDPNAAYTFHGYFDDPSNGANHRSQFYTNVTAAMNQGSAVFVTEFGANYGSTSGSAEIMQACQDMKISMAAWSVNDKVEPWSIFNGFMGSLTEIGSFYRDKMVNWPASTTCGGPIDGCEDATPVTISGSTRIEAEDYCESDGIETETCSEGGQNVGWIDAGDWMAYKIDVPTSGTYTIRYRVASLSDGGSLRIENKGGSPLYGTKSFAATGGWQTWTTVSHEVQLSTGVQSIAIAAETGGWNINWFEIEGGGIGEYSLSTSTTGTGTGTITLSPAGGSYAAGTVVTATATPATGSTFTGWSGAATGISTSVSITMNSNQTLTAEFTANGGSSIFIEAEDFSVMSGIETETCSEGGLNVGWIDAGDWLAYHSIDIPTAGTYTVEYRVASLNGGGILNLEQNSGATLLGQISIPSTGGWQNWTTVSHTVSLASGVQDFGIGVVSGGFNINWIQFTSGYKSAGQESIAQNVNTNSFAMYPNPASESLTVKIDNIENSQEIKIFDFTGKLVFTQQITDVVTDLNISELNPGMYIVKINENTLRLNKQ